jgi:hypothetical protein
MLASAYNLSRIYRLAVQIPPLILGESAALYDFAALFFSHVIIAERQSFIAFDPIFRHSTRKKQQTLRGYGVFPFFAVFGDFLKCRFYKTFTGFRFFIYRVGRRGYIYIVDGDPKSMIIKKQALYALECF